MALEFGAIATIVTSLVEGAKLVSARMPKKDAEIAPPTDSIAALKSRTKKLEAHQVEQDALAEGLAEQLENLATAGQQLDRKVTVLLVISASALFLSLMALLLLVLR